MRRFACWCLAACVIFSAGCASILGIEEPEPVDAGADVSSGGAAGSSGSAGQSGGSGQSGSAGSSGQAGMGGTAGGGGTASGGASGASGNAGEGGTAGTSGSGGTAGNAGVAGAAGNAGGGAAGTSGSGGTAGSAGSGGIAGSAGAGGQGGAAGTAGTSGSGGSAGAAGSCTGQPDFTPCKLTTVPDRDYDICIAETCQSPGCGDTTCNVRGPHFPLADTAQRGCYDLTTTQTCTGSVGTPACGSMSGCGQDAQYGWDLTHSQAQRFSRILVGGTDAIVQDAVTGLVWQGCVAGKSGMSCTGTSLMQNWDDALKYCDALSSAGQTDWRLPDEYELQSIAHYGDSGIGIDTMAFPGTPTTTNHWTSSTTVGPGTNAWFADFSDGTVFLFGAKTSNRMVRCVRGAPTPKPATRFTVSAPVSSEPIVTDHYTGLVWQRCVAGMSGPQCGSGQAQSLSWQDAMKHCESSSWSNITTWRLPSITELFSMTRHIEIWPALDTAVFPGVPQPITSYMRSSSSFAADPTRAWLVGVQHGAVFSAAGAGYSKADPLLVRCVSN
ncbi:MAG: DUF1566 domain-containing protein [Deltaproteobacteria bacterium]|nr:DUF1566 domain-containing protein [Deltaproteobacteria bacterium]